MPLSQRQEGLCKRRSFALTKNKLGSFEFKKLQFLTRLLERGYPKSFAEDILTEIKFSIRKTALQNKPKTSKKIIPFVTTFNPATPNLKKILIKHTLQLATTISRKYSKISQWLLIGRTNL